MPARRLAFLFIPTAIALCAGLAAFSATKVSGRVSDELGTAIKNAHVLFHYDPAGETKQVARPDVAVDTDVAGRFEIELEPGFYDVCIMATAFTPDCRKILVTSGRVVQHDAKLKVDPLVTRHIGDRFDFGASTSQTIRAEDGTVACLALTGPAGPEGPSLGVWVREPVAPAADKLSTLPLDRRDFSKLPIRVVLLQPGGNSTPEQRPPSALDQTLEHPLVDGAPSVDAFVLAVFPLKWVVAGSTIVGERAAVAPGGNRVWSQTRCPITEANVARWR
ncbi:MAG TPA: carboxypeptidase-like regulatory domain-containing protein [Vicinamibacterales bacterium]|nr:carboxypeptidase-like regulatory domain-containing protein [Vicinamibacterales bacterium]